MIAVYAMSVPGSGLIKIGMSKNVEQRRKELRQACHSQALDVIHQVVPGNAAATERMAHYLLDEHRRNGEWFAVTPDQAIHAINEAVAACSAPGWHPPWAKRPFIMTADDAFFEAVDDLRRARRPIPTRADVIREAVARLAEAEKGRANTPSPEPKRKK